jgi:Cytochrome P460
VYVNDVARNTLAAPPATPFSPGAIIVREKLSNANSTTAELLAVMIKRATGFNSAANDWEFLLLNGSVTEVKHREKTGSCQECHTSQKGKDFVFRAYVP